VVGEPASFSRTPPFYQLCRLEGRFDDGPSRPFGQLRRLGLRLAAPLHDEAAWW
jgi:hypothetical protein